MENLVEEQRMETMVDKKEIQVDKMLDKVKVMVDKGKAQKNKARAMEVKKMEKERQMSILQVQDNITKKIMSVKEKNLVEEIQVGQAMNPPFFPLALLHPQTQLLTVNVGERHAAMEVCACPVPRFLVTRLSLLARKPHLVPRKVGASVTLIKGFAMRATCASTFQMATIVQLLLPYAPPCQQWLRQKVAFATQHPVPSSVLRVECVIVLQLQKNLARCCHHVAQIHLG